MTIYYDTHASVTQCHDNNITPKEVHFSIDGRYEMNKASTVTQPTMPGMYSYYKLSCMIATVYSQHASHINNYNCYTDSIVDQPASKQHCQVVYHNKSMIITIYRMLNNA